MTPTYLASLDPTTRTGPKFSKELIVVVLYCGVRFTVSKTLPFEPILIAHGALLFMVLVVKFIVILFTATHNSVAQKFLTLPGLPVDVTKTSEVLAFGPVTQYFWILLVMYSVTSTNELSRLTANPDAPAYPSFNIVTCPLLRSYFSNLPVESLAMIAAFTWLKC